MTFLAGTSAAEVYFPTVVGGGIDLELLAVGVLLVTLIATSIVGNILVCIAVIFVLFLTFMATVKAKAMTNDLIGKYDDSINCQEMGHMYNQKQLSQLAADEWIDYY